MIQTKLLLSVLLISCFVFVAAPRADTVQATGTIYIRADGSIDPPDAPISTFDNVTYVFAGNITSDADGIVVERSNITIDGKGYFLQATGSSSSTGIRISAVNNVTIENMNIDNFLGGVMILGSSYNVISTNSMQNNSWGIYILEESNHNTIIRNNITNNGWDMIYNGWGVEIYWDSYYNIVSGNNVANNTSAGIYISTPYNIIYGNDVENNKWGALIGWGNNKIYHNNFINNTFQTDTEVGYGNIWDDGYPSGGNYWSDYIGTDSNHDGIGDSNYTIDANNNDRYPLMGMFTEFSATSEQHVETICNSTIFNFQFNGTAISFNVTGNNGTTGFCRICIPTALMNATHHIFVNGTETSFTLLPCSNATHSYLYFNYDLNAGEIRSRVLLRTTMGDILIELYDDMPITTTNFINLTRMGIYDGTIFHRVIENFVIQGGDPTGTGYGDPNIPPIPDELPNRHSNIRGSVAMANKGPNTGSSQFYINLVNNTQLDHTCVVFGVVEGMDVVDMISKVQTDANDRPLQNVTVFKAELSQYSTLDVVIIPEFPSFLILPALTLTTLVALMVWKKKRLMLS